MNRTQSMDRLFQTILSLKTIDECYAYFEDLCTIKELNDMSQRLEVAEMLQAGRNYQEISKSTGASTATICRVSKCLNYGSDRYKTVLGRLNETDI